MGKYVLFSPVGMTDPIANYHDGAMLHIARCLHPSKIYIYISREAAVFQERDDRYRRAIRLLGDSLSVDFKVEEITRTDLVDVHLFDEFYDEFEDIIKKIKAENPGHTILLNVSSGTPAMKSALHTIAAMTDDADCVPIQVSTPEKGHNPRKDDVSVYDLETQWECNADCQPNFTNRTSCSKNYNLIMKMKKEILRKHIDAYDYHAALSVAEEIPRLPKETHDYLRAACARIQLDMRGVDSLIPAGGPAGAIFSPIRRDDKRSVAEYLLWLDIKVEKKEYCDFIRGISPLFLDLLEKILEKNGIDMQRYCATSKNRKRALSRERLECSDEGRKILSVLDPLFGRDGFRDSNLGSAQLAPLASHYLNDAKLALSIKELRESEDKCRNIAAHEIVGVTEKWIQNNCGLSPKKIIKILTDLADYSGIPREKIKDSYRAMNEFIKESMI